MAENYDNFLEDYYEKQKEKKRLNTERFSKYVDREIPNNINNIETFLEFWPELQDVTTEKNRKKAHFILLDRIDDFKLYFWKSGYVKKQNVNGTECLFLNNWNSDVYEISERKIYPYSLPLLIECAHQFMLSKKVFNNVESYFIDRTETERNLTKGRWYEIDERTGLKIWHS
jgi:hypothetical protein